MSAVEIAKTYLFINGLLIGSYFVFCLLHRVTALLKIAASHRQLIQIAQVLLFLSITTPIVFSLLPKETIPKMRWDVFHSFSETGAFSPNKNLAATKNRIQTGEPRRIDPFTPSLADRVALLFDSTQSAPLALGFLTLLALGFCFATARLVYSIAKLYFVLKTAPTIRALGRVRVVISDTIAIPFSARLARTSWVALPATLLENAADLRVALRHELQHHRQNDTLWAVMIEILICFFFPNPSIYFWKKEITELQEFSCDQALIGRKRVSSYEYGSCLVRVAEAALGSREMYVGTTCMTAASKNPFYFKSFLRRRVEMFTNHENPRAHRWAGITIGTIAAMSLMTLAFGTEQSLRSRVQTKANAGEVVVDPEIQKIADGVLANAIREEGAKAGFAIVADPNTGKILAIANIDTTGKQTGYWSLSELFEPASVIKSLIAAQAIEKGLTTSEERHLCENGNYRYGDRVYHDWKKTGWYSLSTAETIINSSDICSIKLAEKIGPQGIVDMLKGFGFGPNGTAKDFPQAKTGQLPSPDEDVGHPRLVPYVSMGVGFNITPIEMIQAYGAIANGGNLMVPKSANALDSDAQVIRRVLSPEASEKMRGVLERVVLEGTARAGQSKLYTIAGKTATSHYPRMMPFDPNDGDFAGFIGFAPVKEPRVEIYVGIRDPESDDGAHGGSHASPVFRALAEELLKYMKVAPDKK